MLGADDDPGPDRNDPRPDDLAWSGDRRVIGAGAVSNDPDNHFDFRARDDLAPARGVVHWLIATLAVAIVALTIYAAPRIFHRQPVHVAQQGEQ